MRYHHRELGFDAERIAVIGGSAGGHLAMLAGLTAHVDALNEGGLYTDQSNEVSAIINFYGIPDIRQWGGKHIIEYPEGFDSQRLVGARVAEEQQIISEWIALDPETWALASPVEHLNPSSPPIFVTHGTADTTVPVKYSDQFVEALKELGITHEYHRLEGAPHTYTTRRKGFDLRPALRAFLSSHL